MSVSAELQKALRRWKDGAEDLRAAEESLNRAQEGLRNARIKTQSIVKDVTECAGVDRDKRERFVDVDGVLFRLEWVDLNKEVEVSIIEPETCEV